MNRRMSTGRRVLLIVVTVIGMLTWTVGVIGWTAFGRASDSGGFVDITVAAIQSPAGLSTTSSAIVSQVDAAAKSQGSAISAAGNAAITRAVEGVLAQPDLGNVLGEAIDNARQAFADRPDDGITIDVSAIRDQVVQRLQATNPQLAAQVPAAGNLTITVSPDQVPSGVSTAAGLLSLMKWLPIWLLIATIVFLGIGFLITDDRARTARRVGIAFIVVGIAPILMRLIIPPVVGGAVGEGSAGDIAQVATEATIANWWIALIITVVAGGVMLAAGIALRTSSRTKSGPVVLGR